MKKSLYLIVILFCFLLGNNTFAALSLHSKHSPLGYWKTIDDVTSQPKSILKIEQSPSGDLYGQVVKIFPQPGHFQNERCTACEGSRHNQRILGMVILDGLKQNKDQPSEWNGGQILDPQNGKTYHCNVQVNDNGDKLRVRGYIGVPLFGRSQTWIRA